MECEGLAQRMQALFDSFSDDVDGKSTGKPAQKELIGQPISVFHNNEHCPIPHNENANNGDAMTDQCSQQSWFPWREPQAELYKPQCSPLLNGWLNGTDSTEDVLKSSGDGFKVTNNQSPATDHKTSKLVSVLADSDYSMHHLETDYAHHKHCLHHSYASHITTHFTHTERVNSEQSHFETIPSIEDDNASAASNVSRSEPHHSNNFPHHHQHYHHYHNHCHNHHHRHYSQHEQLTDYHPLPWLHESPPQNKETNIVPVPMEPSNNDCHIGSMAEYEVDNEEPISLEDLKEWRRKNSPIDNNIHTAWNSLQFRVIQWLSDLQCDASVLSAKDDSIASEHIL